MYFPVIFGLFSFFFKYIALRVLFHQRLGSFFFKTSTYCQVSIHLKTIKNITRPLDKKFMGAICKEMANNMPVSHIKLWQC